MKNLKPLRSEEDYQAALGELESLWGAKSGTARADRLEGILGSRMIVSEVLNRRRGLFIEMIRKLHSKLKIPAEALLGPTRL